MEWQGSLIVLDTHIGPSGQEQVQGLHSRGEVEDRVVKRSVAHVVPGLGVGPGLQEQRHDVGELGSLGGGLGEKCGAA